jgi:hypothetical protein
MFRPYLAVAAGVGAVLGTAYAFGAPAWVVYLGTLVAVLAMLPGYSRRDQ